MKKTLILITAIIIFFMPIKTSMFPNEAHAITGKVVSFSAKKMAKEIIKDAAIETAGSLALKHFVEDRLNQYKTKEGFKLVCLPGGLNASGECTKPVQIKTNLSEVDKTNIGNTVDLELDKSINGGVGFSKWQKWLDWVAPVWAISLGVTALTYALDGDVRDLFNEIAISALTILGIIQPVETKEPVIANSDGSPAVLPPSQATQINNGTGSPFYESTEFNFKFTEGGTTQQIKNHQILLPTTSESGFIVVHDRAYSPTSTIKEGYSNFRFGENTAPQYYQTTEFSFSKNGEFYYNQLSAQPTVIKKNGQVIYLSNTSSGLIRFASPEIIYSPVVKSIHVMPKFIQGASNMSIEQHRYYLENGDVYSIESTIQNSYIRKSSAINVQETLTTGEEIATRINIYRDAVLDYTPFEPKFSDYVEVNPLDTSNYIVGDKVAVIPPVAFPYTQPNGDPAYPVPNPAYDPVTNPTADPNIFVDPLGNPITDQDSLIVGDPKITKDLNGNPQVEPPPTTANPSPSPISLTPTEPALPNPTPKPIETEPPVFPEGESCEVGLKLPKFMPLLNTMSDAFPFSIPFDLKDGFDAIFAEMGSQKPEFNYKVNFMGDEQSWKISIPDYFDSWKIFTDSFLIFIFDVGIIYAIYRFMGGGN